MNTHPSRSLAEYMPSAATSSGGGSKDSACEPRMAGQAPKHSPRATSASGPAEIPEPFSGCGTQKKQPASSMGCATQGPFSIRQSGNIGQEILDQNGKIIAWTTDVWVAQVMCKLLTENEGLLG